MPPLTPRHSSRRIRASRLIVFINCLLGARGSLAASQLCDEKIISRTETVALTRDARDATVQLDVLVDRDAVVKAALSAKARGNFGGSDSAEKWANVNTSGATSLRCEGGEASQCSAWYDCGDSVPATAADGVIVADVTISDAVEFDYCEKGGWPRSRSASTSPCGAANLHLRPRRGRRLRRRRPQRGRSGRQSRRRSSSRWRSSS